jgi:hypothetical protein
MAWPVAPRDIGDDAGQLQVHLHQRLLLMLHGAGLGAQECMALARKGAQGHHAVARPEGASQEPVAVQLLQPLAIEHIALAAGDVLHVAGIDQEHLEAARAEQLEEGDPVHAGGLHGHGVHAAGPQPVGKQHEIGGEGAELAHRLVVAVGRHGHEVGAAADVDAGGVGVGDAQRRAARRGGCRGGDAGIASGHGSLLECRTGTWHRIGYVVVITLSNGMPQPPAKATRTHHCR